MTQQARLPDEFLERLRRLEESYCDKSDPIRQSGLTRAARRASLSSALGSHASPTGRLCRHRGSAAMPASEELKALVAQMPDPDPRGLLSKIDKEKVE